MNERADIKYRLRLYPYSGGSVDLMKDGTLAECRDCAARIITRHRTNLEYPIAILDRGSKWELETGEDAAMIGDGEGILVIEEKRESERDDEDDGQDDRVVGVACDNCGVLISEYDAIDGLCPDCWHLLDEEEED